VHRDGAHGILGEAEDAAEDHAGHWPRRGEGAERPGVGERDHAGAVAGGEHQGGVEELIRSCRLDGILADLQSPASAGDAISRIAARLGIHDMPHLTRAFRARYSMSPSETRQRGSADRPNQGRAPWLKN
jgi:AraC-like DNA-binding protein